LPDIAANHADAGCFEKAKDILSASPEGLADQLKSDLASSLIKLGFPDEAEELEVISKLGIEGEGSIAWAHGMASPHRRAVGADSTAAAS